ncbi:ABC transporter permease [bacterium]|nr:ABC transporter permease [bacterium]MCI0606380.1 ABC transporter permease [bacterium]
MSLSRQLARGFRRIINRTVVEQEISDEVKHYLDEATAAQIARGLLPEEAARKVRLEVGSHTNVRERVYDYGWENAIETLVADLGYACRQLRALPVFTAVSVLTIAIGVGATTAIFGAVNPILFEPLPYPDANRIATISEINSDGSRNEGTFGMYRGLLDRNRSFESIAVYKPWQPTMTGYGQPERFNGQRISASYFDVLGIAPTAGRKFHAEEDRLRGPNVIILSSTLWLRSFGGDRTIIGREIILDDESYVVIGVMPNEFENVLSPSAEVWAPLQYDMSQGRAWGHHLRTVGRLRPGVTMDQATQEIDQIGRAVLTEQRPATYGQNVKLVVSSLQKDITHEARPALLAILEAALLVLLIACVNVTNLLLARSEQRRGEFAMRAALGAGRGRLIRQLFTESLLLALLGGIVGIAVAILTTRALIALSPADLPRVGAIGVNGTVFLFALCITTLNGVAFGLIPARNASQNDFHADLQQNSRRAAGQHAHARNALVVGEVALTLVLLVCSGLLWRSLERLFAVDIGFDPSRVLTMQVQTSGLRFESDAETDQFFAQTLDSVKRVPGVTSAALTSQLPLSGDLDEYGVHFEATPSQQAQTYSAFRYAVSPGYIETMRIPIRRGRSFAENDRTEAPFVALISESLAKLRFPRVNPIGQRLRIGPMDGPPYTIIGVAADVKQMSLAVSQLTAVYIPATQWPFADNAMSLVISSADVSSSQISAFRQAIWSVDKDQPITRVATMDDLLAESVAERRFALILFQAFALAALILAAAGIYGVLAGSVAERTREIGVRSALGASRREIIAMIVRQGITLTGFGVAIGLLGAAVVTQAIVAMLFEISPLDPLTYLSVIALLGCIATIASGIPAWRASRIDPATTLRTE